ncbi:MAG TPA: LacI family DNA-binding transcriptional regulator [Opitutaceae bacterium]
MKTTHVTMKQVAAAAGVSQATVSMCLANHPRIPPETRDRIREIATKLGYQPNPYVSALMRVRREGRPPKSAPVIALVNSFPHHDAWRRHQSPTICQIREGAMERATARGYRGQEFWLNEPGMTGERFSNMLHTRGIQGLLISPAADGAAPPQLDWSRFASVGISVPQPSLNLATVCNDHYFSSLQVVRECHRRGYRRPGLVMLRGHNERFQGRWTAGYLVARTFLSDLASIPPLLIESWKETARILKWIRRERIDVLVGAGMENLETLVKGAGLRVPEDIGLAALSVPAPGHAHAGVYQNGRLIGENAMDLLISMVERNERGLPLQAVTMMVEGCWNEGRTLRPRPKA